MMRSKPALIAAAAAGSMLLSGCGAGSLFNRNRPDEFAVQRQAPLVVPPDFALSPPQPGAPRPTDQSSQQQALEALFGPPAPRSQVETSALMKAGTAAPAIRSTVGDPGTFTVAKGAVTRDIVAAPQGDQSAAQTNIPTA